MMWPGLPLAVSFDAGIQDDVAECIGVVDSPAVFAKWLANRIEACSGLCETSGKRFVLRSGNKWSLSIDRINNDVPYFDFNIKLVCVYFQVREVHVSRSVLAMTS
eukprot:COSAG01_NODE_888_length_12915_cov_10.708723_16_plen_105_part_00